MAAIAGKPLVAAAAASCTVTRLAVVVAGITLLVIGTLVSELAIVLQANGRQAFPGELDLSHTDPLEVFEIERQNLMGKLRPALRRDANQGNLFPPDFKPPPEDRIRYGAGAGLVAVALHSDAAATELRQAIRETWARGHTLRFIVPLDPAHILGRDMVHVVPAPFNVPSMVPQDQANRTTLWCVKANCPSEPLQDEFRANGDLVFVDPYDVDGFDIRAIKPMFEEISLAAPSCWLLTATDRDIFKLNIFDVELAREDAMRWSLHFAGPQPASSYAEPLLWSPGLRMLITDANGPSHVRDLPESILMQDERLRQRKCADEPLTEFCCPVWAMNISDAEASAYLLSASSSDHPASDIKDCWLQMKRAADSHEKFQLPGPRLFWPTPGGAPGTSRQLSSLWNLNMLALIQSSRQNFEARAAIRKSWKNRTKAALFVVGMQWCRYPDSMREVGVPCTPRPGIGAGVSDPELAAWDERQRALNDQIIAESQEFRDMLLLNTVDSYNNLVDKVMEGFVWASRFQPDWIMKVDDDAFTRFGGLQRLAKHLAKAGNTHRRRALGLVRAQNLVLARGKWKEMRYYGRVYPPYPHGAAGYALSRSLYGPIVSQRDKLYRYNCEDAAVGVWMHELGLNAHVLKEYEGSFLDGCKARSIEFCCKRPGIVYGHKLTPDEILECARFAPRDH